MIIFLSIILLWMAVLFICAGIGFWPVRSAIKYVLANRNDYGELLAMFGVRSPLLFTFTEEINKWIAREDMAVQRTVDRLGYCRGFDRT